MNVKGKARLLSALLAITLLCTIIIANASTALAASGYSNKVHYTLHCRSDGCYNWWFTSNDTLSLNSSGDYGYVTASAISTGRYISNASQYPFSFSGGKNDGNINNSVTLWQANWIPGYSVGGPGSAAITWNYNSSVTVGGNCATATSNVFWVTGNGTTPNYHDNSISVNYCN